MTTATDPIEIFRPGRFTSVEGVVVDVTLADLQAIADAYDPVAEPAPLVKGHPQLDHPALGWAASLAVVGDRLMATPEHVEPSFAEEVRAKRYRRISPSFYPAGHPSNPRPGSMYLKHVGFLGAAAPAVRGLKPVHFSEAQLEGALTIDLTPEEIPVTDTPDTVAFAEREAALDQREADIQAREAAAQQAVTDARHTAHVSFAEGLIAAGRLAPAGKDDVVGLLDVLAVATTTTVSFGEGDAARAPVDAFKAMLGAATPIVSFGEAAPEKDKTIAVVSFAAPAGHTVDPAALELHGKALAYQAEHAGIGYLDAVRAVS